MSFGNPPSRALQARDDPNDAEDRSGLLDQSHDPWVVCILDVQSPFEAAQKGTGLLAAEIDELNRVPILDVRVTGLGRVWDSPGFVDT